MPPLELVRPDLRDFAGYASARRSGASGEIWLNANESPRPSPADATRRLHRYPEPQPLQLRAALAALYSVDPERVLVTRGSDEGIDLLVRAFCRPGVDAVAIASPCFGMYAVSARIQGAPVVDVPLIESKGEWRWNLDGIAAAVEGQGAHLVFLCSPANPTGQALHEAEIAGLAARLRGRALLVVDEAYLEYSGRASAADLLERFPELVVLRTLSKAHALAGARVGALLAAPALVALLRNLAAPYPIAAPSAAVALRALAPVALARTRQRCLQVAGERERVAAMLAKTPGVLRCYPSRGNFLLARFDDAQAAYERLLDAGIVVRDMRAMPGLGDALRMSIGTRRENSALLAALGARR